MWQMRTVSVESVIISLMSDEPALGPGLKSPGRGPGPQIWTLSGPDPGPEVEVRDDVETSSKLDLSTEILEIFSQFLWKKNGRKVEKSLQHTIYLFSKVPKNSHFRGALRKKMHVKVGL